MPSILLAAFALAVIVNLFVVMSGPRSGRQRLLVVLGSALYALALAAFLYPPTVSSPIQRVTVLTPYATSAEIRTARRAPRALAIGEVTLDENTRQRIRTVPDVSAALAAMPDSRAWRVLGAGLPSSSTPGDLDILFDPPNVPPGIRDAHWPRQLRPGESFNVEGSVTEATPANASVALLDPAGEIVATTPIDEQGQFSMTAATKAAGGVLFSLQVQEDGQTLEHVPLPVDIRAPKPVRVLVRTAAPSFEMRYLKDWARRGGASLVIDTTLSQDRQRREYVNHDKLGIAQLNDSLLSNFDLVILDTRALDSLTATAFAALDSAMRRGRLGVVVVGASDSEKRSGALLPATTSGLRSTVPVALTGASGTQINVEGRFADNSGETVLRALNGDPLAKRLPVEGNAWVHTLIADSHRWITAGQPDTHADYWNTLIDAALPPPTPVSASTSPRLPYAQQRTLLCLAGSEAERLQLDGDDASSQSLSLTKVARRPGERCTVFYADAGWHTVNLDGRAVARLYVLATDDWSVQQRWLAGNATHALAARSVDPVADAATLVAWPRWPFALASLLLAAALWFEQRRFAA